MEDFYRKDICTAGGSLNDFDISVNNTEREIANKDAAYSIVFSLDDIDYMLGL